ncbi:TetR/AcrR family transcriptional regulator [Rhodosalinus sp. K401]|uniref:TetR/AcrR family transcriptional regulator n=1 Tax=Rhodosalinus sp. K401 TaxID=3239195 RepID=UPI003523C6E9
MGEARVRGRPRGFDEGRALDAAVRLFRAEGYDGASVDRLCREMRVPRATLYDRFGGKEGLFLAAVARYADTRIAPVLAALGPAGALREDLTAFYEAVIALATADREEAPGCLVSCALADAAGAHPRFRGELAARYDAMEERITARLKAAEWDGRATTSPESAAALAASIARGLILAARSGAGTAELRPTAEAAVRALLTLHHEGTLGHG